jgi:transposase InsO family protein
VVGKATIKPVLDEYCSGKGLQSVSESTIGRVLSDLKRQGKIPLKRVYSLNGRTGRLVERPANRCRLKLRRKGFLPRRPGDLVQMDAICLFDNGVKRYILSAIDLTTRFTFALCYKALTSLSAKDLLARFLSLAPFKVCHVQTDNGSEFECHFRRAAEQLGITHFFNYPRHPQGNAHVERFHRTLREQFLDWCEEDPADLNRFNKALAKWLLWYNLERPHRSLGRLPPLRYLLHTFAKNPNQSHMWWTHTDV